MNEFDELLNGILIADVRVDPPEGMDGRIKAALSAATKPPWFERRHPREAIAAMLLIGVVGILAVRYRSGFVPAANRGEERSIAAATVPGLKVETAAVTAVSRRKGPPHRSGGVDRSGQLSRRTVDNLMPLQVGPLVIEPIEIASLASDDSTKHSQEIGERR